MPSRALFLFLCLAAAPLRAQESVPDIAQLLQLEDRRVFDAAALQRAAQHPDATVRIRAAMAIGHIGDPAGVPLLLPLLDDRDSTVRVEAVFALGRLGDRSVVPELASRVARFSTGSDFEVEVVTALARLGGPEGERALGAILDRHPPESSSQGDRATAQVLLEAWRLGAGSAIAPRLKDYIHGASGGWRRNAAYSATRIPRFADAASALLEAANDDDAYTRSYVARGLTGAVADSSGLARDAFVAVLRAMVNDSDWGVRINALRALGTYQDSSLASVAASKLVDRHPNVIVQAAATLGQLGGSRAAALLAERIPGAPTFGPRRAMLLALAQISPPQAIEAARTWRIDSDWRTRAAYAEMLAVARTPAARQQLVDMLTDPEPRVVGFVLGALGTVVPRGDTTLVSLARARLAAGDVIVRAAAIDLVGRERSAGSVRELATAFRTAETDALDDARRAALNALADIYDSIPAARGDIQSALFANTPRSPDYIVRRLAAARFGDQVVRQAWGGVGPVETGRTAQEYQDLARRYVRGQASPGNVTIETERGNIVLQLYAADAPLTVDNFLRLIDRRYFDNGRWHRVVPNFVIQDGDPRGDGSGGPGTTIRDEINRHRYDRGTVGMALSGPDTGGSQFFITHSPQPHLDGGYTVFGQVVSGWDTIEQIVQGDRIRRIFH